MYKPGTNLEKQRKISDKMLCISAILLEIAVDDYGAFIKR